MVNTIYIRILILFGFIMLSCSTTQKGNYQPKTEKELLIEAAEQLNGLWKKAHTDTFVTITLSKENFTGTWFSKSYISTAPLIELKSIEGRLHLVFIDITGGVDIPKPITINDNKLTIDYGDGEIRKYVKINQTKNG